MRTITNPQFNRTQHPTFKFIMGNYIVIIHKLAFYLLEEKKCAGPYLLRNKSSSDHFFSCWWSLLRFKRVTRKALFRNNRAEISRVYVCRSRKRKRNNFYVGSIYVTKVCKTEGDEMYHNMQISFPNILKWVTKCKLSTEHKIKSWTIKTFKFVLFV